MLGLRDKEDVIEIFKIGSSIKDKIQGLTSADVKELYIFLINQIQLRKISNDDIINGAKFTFPMLAPEMIGKIALTEFHRIHLYEKIIEINKYGRPEDRYEWTPYTCFTSPLDHFLYTGELKSEEYRHVEPLDCFLEGALKKSVEPKDNSAIGYDYEYLRSELPEWNGGVYTLEELRNTINCVYSIFHKHGIERGEMLTDWLTPSGVYTVSLMSRLTKSGEMKSLEEQIKEKRENYLASMETKKRLKEKREKYRPK